MGETLTPELFTEGILNIIYIVVTTITGLLIASKYLKYKENVFLYVGLSTIGLSSPWWPATASFVSILLTQQKLTEIPYFILGISLAPIFAMLWLAGVNILFEKKEKLILIFYSIIYYIFEIAFFSVLIIDSGQIGSLIGPLNVKYEPWIRTIMGILILFVLVTGLMFSIRSIKSTNPEINVKGKLLTIAFIFWSICSVVDTTFTLSIELLLFIRILLILTSITFYVGWILPGFSKNILRKLGILKDGIMSSK
ncbi:MAG: hypothetical protein ACFFAS_14165 [Promethearchaeota archaeon]